MNFFSALFLSFLPQTMRQTERSNDDECLSLAAAIRLIGNTPLQAAEAIRLTGNTPLQAAEAGLLDQRVFIQVKDGT